MTRVEIHPLDLREALKDAQVTHVELAHGLSDEGYIVLTFNNGTTLYADNPTAYTDAVTQDALDIHEDETRLAHPEDA